MQSSQSGFVPIASSMRENQSELPVSFFSGATGLNPPVRRWRCAQDRRGVCRDRLSLSQIPSGWREATNRAVLPAMADILKLICWAVIGLFRSRASLEAEILTLRQQLKVLRRKSPKRPAFSNFDRLIFAGLYQIAPCVLNALAIMESETVVRWHRACVYRKPKSGRSDGVDKRRKALAELTER